MTTTSKAIFGKSSWPELVGKLAEPATAAIVHDRPDVSVVVLRPGSRIPPDFNPERVRLLVNNKDVVTDIPVLG